KSFALAPLRGGPAPVSSFCTSCQEMQKNVQTGPPTIPTNDSTGESTAQKQGLKPKTPLKCPILGPRIGSSSRAGNPVPAQPPPREGNQNNGTEDQNPQNRKPAPRPGRSPTAADHRPGGIAARLGPMAAVFRLRAELS